MGSACLFFALQPDNALLSDSNIELVDTFLAVRDHPRAVHNRLTRIPRGKESYYSIRGMDTSKMEALDRAARFIFLNRYCFNGLYRTNQAGRFNVPFSPSGTGDIPSWDKFWAIAKGLKGVKILRGDFEQVLTTEVKERDLVYLDPPYAVENRRIFHQYGPQTFGLDDIARLKKILTIIEQRGAYFVLSYAFCREANDAFRAWNVKKVLTQRNISGFAQHRRRAAELIITNIKDE